MSDRFIHFTGPMIRALLEGRKTQTRRVIKPQPPADVVRHCWYDAPFYGFTSAAETATFVPWHTARLTAAPGDRLWVREAYCGHWCGPSKPGSNRTAPGSGRAVTRAKIKQRDGTVVEATEDDPLSLWYRADNEALPYPFAKWQSSRFMPRWASRLTLIVTDVRVERLQDISEEDAIAEGVGPLCHPEGRPDLTWVGKPDNCKAPNRVYKDLWDTINAKRGHPWKQNPWVAAYTFRVIKQNIDEAPNV